jgi:hypothetical protein
MSTLEALEESSLQILLALQAYEVGFPKLSASNPTAAPSLSPREEQTLELFDRLEELRIETSLLEAQSQVSKGYIFRLSQTIGIQLTGLASRDDAGVLDQHLKGAERDVVEARARYFLRKKVIEGVLTTDPSLRSVHVGENIQSRERCERAT